MAYVYRHIRLDKNQPFYIGVGTCDTYERAYSKKTAGGFIWKFNKIKSNGKTSYVNLP